MTLAQAFADQHPGFRLVPVGGRPPKTARDVAVLLAYRWFAAGAPPGRPKLREQLVDLWNARGYRGLSDPAHVTARMTKGTRALGPGNGWCIATKGAGTRGSHVGPGAGVVFVPESSAAESAQELKVGGPVWVWEFGAEHADHYSADGVISYRAKE